MQIYTNITQKQTLFYFSYIWSMKYAITILIIGNIILVTWLYFTTENNKRLEADLTHLNNSIDRMVDKRVNDVRMKVTDSLLKEFNERPPDTIIKKEIQYRYEKITDTILIYPSIKQYRWSANELERLYAD